jgi:hypothetical protein
MATNRTWVPPATAVEPVNHFHTIYMRLAAMSDALIHEASTRDDVLKNPVFGELIGSIAELSNLSARMTVKLEGIRRDFPDLWEIWQRASRCERTAEDGL